MHITFGGQLGRDAIISRLSGMPNIAFTAVTTVEEMLPHVPGSDVLVLPDPRGEPGRKLAELLNRPDNTVRWVQCVSAGTAGLTAHPLPAGLIVTHQGGAVAPVVAEHVIGLAIAANRRFDVFFANATRGEWNQKVDPPYRSLEGLTICVVGFGNIGREVARKARAFKMRVVGVRRSGESDKLADEVIPLARLHEALAVADVIVICLASVKETAGTIDAAALAAAKPGAVLVNVARGELVDQPALAAALKSGHLRGAALDVTTPEPLPPDHMLWKLPNIIITPHMAGGGSKLTGQRIAAVLVENLRRFREGRDLIHRVSTEAMIVR